MADEWTIRDYTRNFLAKERPVGVLLDEKTVEAQMIAAVRAWAGFAGLACFDYAQKPAHEIARDTEITATEWARIRPLFLLYLEREQALQLEASRGMGIDPYGRSSSEIAAEIQQFEQDLPHQAFCIPVFEVPRAE